MAIQSIQEKGQICILDIEMQGVIQIKKIPELHPNFVFVANELEAMPKIDARLTNEEPITDMMKLIITQL